MDVRSPLPAARRPTRLAQFTLGLCLGLAAVAGSASALDSGARMPELGLSDLGGKTVNLGSLAGKVVIVDFWATWCAPCKESMPVLERLYQKYRSKGLVVVGVSVDEDAANVGPFIKKLKVSFPIAHDKGHKVADRFKPPKMPSSYVIDRKGIVRHVHEGFHAKDAAALDAEIAKLLQ